MADKLVDGSAKGTVSKDTLFRTIFNGTMRKGKQLKWLTVTVGFLVFITIGLTVYFMGLLDYVPKLRAEAQSPDGTLTVRIYQKRLSPRPLFPRMGAVAKVFDRQGKLVYEKVIYNDDDWDDSVGSAYREISFSDNEIRIGPGPYDPNKLYVIKKSEFK